METEGLEDFLKGADPVEEVVTEPANPEPEPQPAAQPRNPDGTFATKGEPAAEPQQSASPAPEKQPEPNLDHPALLGERRRRQEAEARLAELEARFAQPTQPAQPQPQTTQPTMPDRWEDPEGYDQWLISQAEQRAAAAAEQRFIQRHIDISESAARGRHADFEEKLAVFNDLVRANPLLGQQMVANPDPAEFAYTTAAKAMEVQQYGSIDQLVAAKVAEALAAAQPAPAPATPTIPTTLADQQSAKASAAAPHAPPTLADILKR